VTELTIQEAVAVLSQKFILEEGVAGVSYRVSEPRIVVYVEDEETARRVPSTLLGYRVEVVVTGRLYALGAVGRSLSGAVVPKTSRIRPVPGGVSVGTPLVTAGTLGCVVYDAATGRPLMLSNRHVFWGPVGTSILQPGAADGGRAPDDVIGRVLRFEEIRAYPDTNVVDAALGEPLSTSLLSPEVLDVGVISGVGEAREGAVVCKSGRTTCYTCGTIIDTRATVKVYGYDTPGGFAVFEDQVIVEPAISRPGDSGSVAVYPDSKAAVGLVFAGSDMVTVMNKATNVCRVLGVSFTPRPARARPPESVAPLVLALAPLGFVCAVVVVAGRAY